MGFDIFTDEFSDLALKCKNQKWLLNYKHTKLQRNTIILHKKSLAYFQETKL